MNLNLNNKSVLLTGSSTGIGFSIAKALHSEGCRVVLNGRNMKRLEEAVSKLPGSFGVVGDVSVVDEAKRVVESSIKTVGHIDILICCVGSGDSVAPGLEDPIEWQRVFALNFWSATNVIEIAKESLTSANGVVWSKV